MNIQI